MDCYYTCFRTPDSLRCAGAGHLQSSPKNYTNVCVPSPVTCVCLSLRSRAQCISCACSLPNMIFCKVGSPSATVAPHPQPAIDHLSVSDIPSSVSNSNVYWRKIGCLCKGSEARVLDLPASSAAAVALRILLLCHSRKGDFGRLSAAHARYIACARV